ncbi:ras-related and estrogen-regulated growth inhibitor-like protein isoform X2 [Sitodiplosis mosellana]|nr:ras-related and estrogen-regulated growth inhibitor-like protein isoform X2 [Sitodiplosis mosellana]XP_055294940.1 ras-related and estrogen-regulated growth inhibitor-like protein isoform X2 [Sitodiplosis mosellana]XP_055294941.1 ras-related and estrogen-regulated growth inhibitor-like protein isoform X2 [Sitodiplosis mosellana]
MKAEDKNPLQRVRIAVLGNVNVGKSALTVRYLTRRYIGEYRSKTDLLYRQTISLDSGMLDVEIVDVSAETDNEFPIEQIQWADSCLIVYSITDRESFKYATRALGNLKSLQNGPSAYLIANKADLDHLREVSESEGASLAASHHIGFCEVSVADNTPSLYKAFERLLNDSKGRPVKQQRKFSVSKMIGTLIGTNDTKATAQTSGTMVPCCKGELHKTRVLKRRQGFIATASL